MRLLVFIFITAAFSAPVYAVTDQERSLLLALDQELETIAHIIDEAQQAANPDHRRQVNYQKLRDDLAKIRQGLVDSVNEIRREPQSLPEIEGEYR